MPGRSRWGLENMRKRVKKTEYNPNHWLLTKPDATRYSTITQHAMPRPGVKADILFHLLRDRDWHTVKDCFDYVKQNWNGTDISPTRFGQRGLDRYIEVIIVGDRMRIGKRHSA